MLCRIVGGAIVEVDDPLTLALPALVAIALVVAADALVVVFGIALVVAPFPLGLPQQSRLLCPPWPQSQQVPSNIPLPLRLPP